MPINIGDNFSYLGKKFLDNRESFNTLEEMNACDDVPIGFITYCIENKKRYEYTESGWTEYIVNNGEGAKEVEMSDTKPTDDNILMWINISEEAQTEIIAKINDKMTASNTTWSSEKIDNAIKNIDISDIEVDLSDYVTKEELSTKANIDDIPTKVSDLTNDNNYVNEDYVENKIEETTNSMEIILSSDTKPIDENVSIWINTSEDTITNSSTRINDEAITNNTTWSSEKINVLFGSLKLVKEDNVVKLMLGDIELSNILIE